jgi:hypothetical protein
VQSQLPQVFQRDGFRFFLYADEGSPREPVHVHVRKDDREAKFWVHPQASVAYNDGFDARTLRLLMGQVDAIGE